MIKDKKTEALLLNKTVFGQKSQKGIALITVLWVLTILTVMVLSFSYISRIETYAALSFRQGAENRFLAEAGIERGIMEVFFRKINKNQTLILEEGLKVWKTDGTPYKEQTNNGYYTVSITDETGKVDINRTTDVILRNMFKNLGLEQEKVDTIVDSIIDWKDADDLHRLHGAETDYYMSLPNPYKAKDADFETIEELLLVKGMTPAILYGDNGEKGIIDFITVHSQNRKINFNAAPKEVLMAIPGMTSDIADVIVSRRETRETLDNQEIKVIAGGSYSLMSPYITVNDSSTYTIDALGYKDSQKSAYGIRGTVTLLGRRGYKYLYYKSPAELKT